MANTQVAERDVLYEMIRVLPNDKIPSAIDYIRFLASDDEPPLTDDELAQIAKSRENIAAGRFSTLEEVMERLADLP